MRASNNLGKSKAKKKEQQKIYQKGPHLKKLLSYLSESYNNNNNKLIDEILEKRKQKKCQLTKNTFQSIQQQPVRYCHSVEMFQLGKPLSYKEQFMEYKYRANLMAPSRAFNHQPNMKAGYPKMVTVGNDPRVIDGMFKQYVRVIDEQQGLGRRNKFSKKMEGVEIRSLPQIKSRYKSSMRQTFFKKYQSDLYNFYKTPIKQITRIDKIFDLTSLQRQSTFNSRISNNLSKPITTRPSFSIDTNGNINKKNSIGSTKIKTIISQFQQKT